MGSSYFTLKEKLRDNNFYITPFLFEQMIFTIENVLNTYYALRPSKPSAPRTFTLQTKFSF